MSFSISQNGFPSSRITYFRVESCGKLIGSLNSHAELVIGQLILAEFTNPDGLSINSEGLYEETGESGPPALGKPRSDGFPLIDGGGLQP
ncbi:MAG: hypothetical protein K6L80_16230 [Agarilytica sp.]